MKNILKLRLNRHLLSLAMGVGMLGVLIVGNVGTALASGTDGITGTTTINGGTTLSATIESSNTNINNGTPTALDGTAQPSLPMAMPIDVINDLGTGIAWTVSIKADDFHTNAPDYNTTAFTNNDCNIAPTNPSDASVTRCLQNMPDVTVATATPNSETTGIAPTHNTANAISALTSDDQTLFSFNADNHVGMGAFTITPTMHLGIKDSDYAGSYSSNITVTIA